MFHFNMSVNAQYVRSAVPQSMYLRWHQQYHYVPSTSLPNRPMIPSKEAPASKKPRQNTDNSAVQRLNFMVPVRKARVEDIHPGLFDNAYASRVDRGFFCFRIFRDNGKN
jgi:hypothetical protein